MYTVAWDTLPYCQILTKEVPENTGQSIGGFDRVTKPRAEGFLSATGDEEDVVWGNPVGRILVSHIENFIGRL